MSKVQKNSVADQIKQFTIQGAQILTAAGPGLLIIVIVVAAVSAAYIEYQYHSQVIGQFALVSGGGYGMFRFSVGTAGIQVAKENKWVAAFLFVAISLGFTIWSSFHIAPAAEILRIGGTPEAAEIILLTVLWMAFAGELVLGIFSYIMQDKDQDPGWIAPGGFIAHQNNTKMNTDFLSAEYELQQLAKKAAARAEKEREIKQRLRLYKKRYAKHVQKKRYNDKNGLETSLRTVKAIQNNKQWIEHYQKQLDQLIR